MSSAATEYGAIVAAWVASCPVAANRRDYAALGGPLFDRPKIPSPGTLTASNRLSVLGGVVWIRLAIDGVPRSARPQGIAPASPQRRIGFVTQHIYYPLGFGLDFALAKVDLARAVFHRQNLSSGLVQFRDAEAPDWIEMPEDVKAGWGRVDCANAYWVTEVV